MRKSISAWVEHIQTLHARSIDLSLERVALVYKALKPKGVGYRVITVAGTNGKGSTSELVASILRAANFSVGKYTSPHLISFNERFNIDGKSIDDDALVDAFERVEAARADVTLTFFEFGTLVAIELFAIAKVDIAVMEVGLGGRLDAVNILDPDVAVVTNVSVDHTAWLGNTLAEIAAEKFGVARANKPCVIGMSEPPDELLRLAREKSVLLFRIGVDFNAVTEGAAQGRRGWRYEAEGQSLTNLPLPFNQAGHQLLNAATAIAAIHALDPEFEVTVKQIKTGLARASNRGRCEVISTRPTVILDVAHNVASVAALAATIAAIEFDGRLVVVCGMLADKEIELALAEIAKLVDVWHFASINNKRGATAEFLSKSLRKVNARDAKINLHNDVMSAFLAAKKELKADDCLVVFGSFFVAGDILSQSI